MINVHPSLVSSAMAEAYCKLHGLAQYIQDAAQLVVACPQPCNVSQFMAEYLSSVVGGQHVLWRHFGYISGTHHNRKVFLACVRRTLTPITAAGSLTMGDVHSLLLLLCPDVPLATVKNAWSAAVAIQAWSDQAKQQPPAGAGAVADSTTGPLVQLPVFLQCFEVTFYYEQYLMALRNKAFTQDKKCVGLQQLDDVMEVAAARLPSQGWPVLSAKVMKRCINQASKAATYPDFAFVELIKAVCSCQETVLDVRGQLAAAAAASAASAAAFSAASRQDIDRSSSSLSSDMSEDSTAAPYGRPWK